MQEYKIKSCPNTVKSKFVTEACTICHKKQEHVSSLQSTNPQPQTKLNVQSFIYLTDRLVN